MFAVRDKAFDEKSAVRDKAFDEKFAAAFASLRYGFSQPRRRLWPLTLICSFFHLWVG